MGIRVAYTDMDREYALHFSEYVRQYCSEVIDLEEMTFDELINGSIDSDILLVGGYGTFDRNLVDTDKLMVLDENNSTKDIFRYQRLETIISLIKRRYVDNNRLSYIDEIKQYIIDNYDLARVSNEQLKDMIVGIVDEHKDSIYWDEPTKILLSEQVYSSIRGLGILDKLLEDEEITEVMINDYDCIFIEKNGCLKRYEGVCFESREQLMDIIQKIVGKTGREVNQANPIVDTRLEDGSRVNVVLSPIALNGHAMTIRRFSKEPMTMDKLISYGSVTPEIARKLECLVKAKYNIIVSGGTGSGKTTFLNALSNFIPKDERIITIEDSAELQIKGIDNLVSLETRNANSSGAGKIVIRDLIRSSLRMRPDRIVVGEVRGEEALDMLQAMNTGHDGSLSTAHANSSRDMISRLSTMVLQGTTGLPHEAIKQQIASAVDIIIHLSRLRDHSRKLMEISEVIGYEDGEVKLNPLYVFEEIPGGRLDKVEGRLIRTENPLYHREKLLAAGILEEI